MYILAKLVLEYYISPTKPMLWFKAVKKSSNRTLMRNMEICRKLQTAVCAVLNYILYSLAAVTTRCHRRRAARLRRQICNWHTNWDKSVAQLDPSIHNNDTSIFYIFQFDWAASTTCGPASWPLPSAWTAPASGGAPSRASPTPGPLSPIPCRGVEVSQKAGGP